MKTSRRSFLQILSAAIALPKAVLEMGPKGSFHHYRSGNVFLTSREVSQRTLSFMALNLDIQKSINRAYSQEFEQKSAKIGHTLSIQKPPRFIGRTQEEINALPEPGNRYA